MLPPALLEIGSVGNSHKKTHFCESNSTKLQMSMQCNVKIIILSLLKEAYAATCSDFQLEYPLNCAMLVCSNAAVLSCVIQCGLLDLKHTRSRMHEEWSCL